MTHHEPAPDPDPSDDEIRVDLRRVTVLANDRKVMIDRLRRENEILRAELTAERAAHTHTIREHGLLSTRRWFWK